MNERYLLDSSAAFLWARQQPRVVPKLSGASAVFVPLVVIGEMIFGAYNYARKHNSTKFLDLVDTWLTNQRPQVLAPTLNTTRIYGPIAAELEAKGQRMQANDIWIAALARQYNLTVLTTDRDFTRVNGLSVELI
jgi:tRNA(fMet)-specific endonuclease VapC